MKRGGYGKPWRKPADGWASPPRTYLGGLYQHCRPALNNIPRNLNVTNDIPLQLNQVGPPVTRANATQGGAGSCGNYPINALPKIPWVGVGDNQYLLSSLPNKFARSGTVDFGRLCRTRGGKWVQAVRQWHGSFPWTSHDGGACSDMLCPPGSAGPSYESRQYPSQVKYLTQSISSTLAVTGWNGGSPFAPKHRVESKMTGNVTIEQASGKVINNLVSTEKIYCIDPATGVETQTKNVSGGAGWQNEYMRGGGFANSPASSTVFSVGYPKGMSTMVDIASCADVHCDNIPFPASLYPLLYSPTGGEIGSGSIEDWVTSLSVMGGFSVGDFSFPGFTAPTNRNSYDSGTLHGEGLVDPDADPSAWNYASLDMRIQWSRTDTLFAWSVSIDFSLTENATGNVDAKTNYSWSGSKRLTNANLSSAVYYDITNLLSYWPLNDDQIYPPRMDGVWQIAPLVSRDEFEGNVSPLQGFLPATVDDLRHPITDKNGNGIWTSPSFPPPPGWRYEPANHDDNGRAPGTTGYSGAAPWIMTYAQIPWFDTNAYGFRFPPGRTMWDSAAISLEQFALSGKVLGMPMPYAFTSTESALYGMGPATSGAYENFFDFLAKVWKCCDYTNPSTGEHQKSWYLSGYGQWLSDIVSLTGAELPKCCTQWTNNFAAMSKPPYAYVIEADFSVYSSPPATIAYRGDAVWAQKCMEVGELWPSQNLARPAAMDRYQRDETKVNCLISDDGTTMQTTAAPLVSAGSPMIIAGSADAANDGVWNCLSVSLISNNVVRGAFLRKLPSDFPVPAAPFVAALRWPDCPAILGRAEIYTITDELDPYTHLSTGNCIIELIGEQTCLKDGDSIQLYTDTVTTDVGGNRGTEYMTLVSASVYGFIVTRIDDKNFKITAAYSDISDAEFIQTTGLDPQNWEWDDTGRKGDFSSYSWTFDKRTNAQRAEMTGRTDCSGAALTLPTANHGFSEFTQTQRRIPFKPCCQAVMAITPNGETWNNAVVIPFPSAFDFDERYGARWQGEIEQAMADVLWQSPASPCGFSGSWRMDDGTCNTDNDEATPPIRYFPFFPVVESLIIVPGYGGNDETDTAPTPPTGIGHLSPVLFDTGLQPPGQIGFDATTGNPVGAWTVWGYRYAIESSGCAPESCRFDYVGTENLACASVNPPPPPAGPVDANTGDNSPTDTGTTV